MRKITIVQKNWDGQGNDRTFTRWVKLGQIRLALDSIARAYNMDHTEVSVTFA